MDYLLFTRQKTWSVREWRGGETQRPPAAALVPDLDLVLQTWSPLSQWSLRLCRWPWTSGHFTKTTSHWGWNPKGILFPSDPEIPAPLGQSHQCQQKSLHKQCSVRP